MRTFKPIGGYCASYHNKSVVIDGVIVFTGSVNLTHNGFENNKEHLVRIIFPDCVQSFRIQFMEDWESPHAQQIVAKDIVEMERRAVINKFKRMRAAAKKKEREAKGLPPSDEEFDIPEQGSKPAQPIPERTQSTPPVRLGRFAEGEQVRRRLVLEPARKDRT